MYSFLIIFGCALVAIHATEVSKCGQSIPFPLSVDVRGCAAPPCDIVKGTSVEFKIHLLAQKFITSATTLVKAKTLGITVPYELPTDVSDVCSNLMYEAFCPLYPTEDVTYLFLFPIANSYPEISVNVKIYIVDQKQEIVTCFKCDIKVKKGSFEGSTALFQLDWLKRNSTQFLLQNKNGNPRFRKSYKDFFKSVHIIYNWRTCSTTWTNLSFGVLYRQGKKTWTVAGLDTIFVEKNGKLSLFAHWWFEFKELLCRFI